jgi:hypothetical protein
MSFLRDVLCGRRYWTTTTQSSRPNDFLWFLCGSLGSTQVDVGSSLAATAEVICSI